MLYKFSGKPEFYNSVNVFIVYLPNLNHIGAINDATNDATNQIDAINGATNDATNQIGAINEEDIEKEITLIVQNKPGIDRKGMVEQLQLTHRNVTTNSIRNLIRRKMKEIVEFKGPKKSGGYYIKSKEKNETTENNNSISTK